jgi:hypothetical protein
MILVGLLGSWTIGGSSITLRLDQCTVAGVGLEYANITSKGMNQQGSYTAAYVASEINRWPNFV